MTYQEGYDRALHAIHTLQKQAAKKEMEEEDESDEEGTQSDGGEGEGGTQRLHKVEKERTGPQRLHNSRTDGAV